MKTYETTEECVMYIWNHKVEMVPLQSGSHKSMLRKYFKVAVGKRAFSSEEQL